MKLKKKICLLGPYGVGKTSLVRRYVYNKFEEKYLSTIGVEISKKKIILDDFNDIEIELLIWDIANIDKFDAVIKTYLKGADGAIFVLDLTRITTIDQIGVYIENFKKVNGIKPFVMVFNKSDLINQDSDDFGKYKHKFSENDFVYTSAKTGNNVELLFEKMAMKIIEQEIGKNKT